MLKLFATKGTISVAVALVLEEVGAEYELCLIDFATEDQRSQAYLEINSKGRVPSAANLHQHPQIHQMHRAQQQTHQSDPE